jgi:hypothetical protein
LENSVNKKVETRFEGIRPCDILFCGASRAKAAQSPVAGGREA